MTSSPVCSTTGSSSWARRSTTPPPAWWWPSCCTWSPRTRTKDIQFYINSPGGSVTGGMAIYDTMQYIKCDVSTICIGMAASMGAFLLSSGAKGKRFALPNAEIMIHQPSAGTQGQITDMAIHLKRLEPSKADEPYPVGNTGKPGCGESPPPASGTISCALKRPMEYGLIDKGSNSDQNHVIGAGPPFSRN